jgi:hypothetical protein
MRRDGPSALGARGWEAMPAETTRAPLSTEIRAPVPSMTQMPARLVSRRRSPTSSRQCRRRLPARSSAIGMQPWLPNRDLVSNAQCAPVRALISGITGASKLNLAPPCTGPKLSFSAGSGLHM